MDTSNGGNGQDLKIKLSILIAALGLLTFTLGAHPNWFGLETTKSVGFLQILFMVIGLGVFSAGTYAAFRLLWNGRKVTIIAQIGGRLIATGYVVAAASVMADVLGLGSQSWPRTAHFGPLQHFGLLTGEAIIAVGLLMLYPWSHPPQDEQ